jgi:hypothetical protein
MNKPNKIFLSLILSDHQIVGSLMMLSCRCHTNVIYIQPFSFALEPVEPAALEPAYPEYLLAAAEAAGLSEVHELAPIEDERSGQILATMDA